MHLHFNGHVLGQAWLASSPPFPSSTDSQTELSGISGEVSWSQCPSCQAVTQPTVSKHWRKLKVLTPNEGNHPMASLFFHPSPDWGNICCSLHDSHWCQVWVPQWRQSGQAFALKHIVLQCLKAFYIFSSPICMRLHTHFVQYYCCISTSVAFHIAFYCLSLCICQTTLYRVDVPSGILIHPAIWPQYTWAENWGAVPLFCRRGQLRWWWGRLSIDFKVDYKFEGEWSRTFTMLMTSFCWHLRRQNYRSSGGSSRPESAANTAYSRPT